MARKKGELTEPDVFIDKLNYIINSYAILISESKRRIKKHDNSESKETAEVLLQRFYLSFYTKIVWPVILDEYRYEEATYKPYQTYLKIAKESLNDDAKYIFTNFSILATEAFNYLGEKKLIAQGNIWKGKSMLKIKEFSP